MMTTQQAATELGVSRARVLAMIRAGRLKADKFGDAWMIRPAQLDKVRHRKPGRPRLRAPAG
jgi:excisionase family DNA binding protein